MKSAKVTPVEQTKRSLKEVRPSEVESASRRKPMPSTLDVTKNGSGVNVAKSNGSSSVVAQQEVNKPNKNNSISNVRAATLLIIHDDTQKNEEPPTIGDDVDQSSLNNTNNTVDDVDRKTLLATLEDPTALLAHTASVLAAADAFTETEAEEGRNKSDSSASTDVLEEEGGDEGVRRTARREASYLGDLLTRGDEALPTPTATVLSFKPSSRAKDLSPSAPAAEGIVRESALNEADVASTALRPTNFTPYAHTVHDRMLLRSVLDVLEKDPPLEIKMSDSYRASELRQAENNATLSCHDCLGMNREMTTGFAFAVVGGGGLNATANLHSSDASGTPRLTGTALSSVSSSPLLFPSVYHVGEESVLYPCGRHLTIASITDTSARRLLTTSDRVLSVVTYVVSADGKYLAVSERYVDFNSISIYRVDSGAKVSTLDYRMIAKSLVTELHFSSNNRYLVTITGQPEHKLILWHLEEMRVVGVREDLSATPIRRIRFSGWHSASLVSVCSSSLLLWTHAERDITPIDVIQHHEQRKRDLAKQQYHDVHGYKRGEVQPKTRIVPSSVSKINLFGWPDEPVTTGNMVSSWHRDGDGSRFKPNFVATEWYEDKCFAALTSDGWFLAVEEDLKIKMCFQIGLPVREERVRSAHNSDQNNITNTTATDAPKIDTKTAAAAAAIGSKGAQQTDEGFSTVEVMSEAPSSKRPSSVVSSAADAASVSRSILRALASSSSTHQQRSLILNKSSQPRGIPDGARGAGPPNSSMLTADEAEAGGSRRHYLSSVFSALCWCSRGLLVTGPHGWITLLDRTYDDAVPFVQMANISVCGPMDGVLSLTVSPGETNAVLAFSTNQMRYFSLPALDDAIDSARSTVRDDGGASAMDRERSRIGSDSAAITPASGTPMLVALSPIPTNAQHTARGEGNNSSGTAPISLHHSQQLQERGVVLDGESVMKPLLHTQFHQSLVTSISVALQRPLLATSALDGTVMVYDYVSRRQVCTHTFNDTVLSCSLHPMGTQIVVCESFTTGLYGVLDTGFVLLTVIGVRGAQFARFSANGGRIAFVVSNRVIIFNSGTLESCGMLVGHAANVKGVRWCDGDTRLVTCDVSGAILHWNAFTCKRIGSETSHRNVVTSGVCGFTQENSYAIVGCTRQTRGAALEGEFTVVGSSPPTALTKTQQQGGEEGDASTSGARAGLDVGGVVCLRPGFMYPRSAVASRKFHTNVLCFAEVSKTLFVGTPTGRILLYSWPLLRTSTPYRIIDAHEGEVLHLLLSHDEQFLFTVGTDNVCYMYQVQHMKNGRFMAIPSFDYALTDPVKLVGAEVQQRNVGAEVEVLNELIKFKGEDIGTCQRTLKRNHEKQCADLVKTSKKKIESLKAEISKTKADCKQLVEKSHKERRDADKQFHVASEAIENQYGRLTEAHQAKLKLLEASKENLVLSFENANAVAVRRWEDSRVSLEESRLEREKQLSDELQRLQQEIRARGKDAEAMIDQTIIDGERELHQLQMNQTAVLRELLDAIQRVGHVQSFGEREAQRLRKEINNHRDELVTKAIIHSDLEKQVTQNAAKNASHRNSNKMRQEEINVAEKNLQQLRQQLGSLENLRFVLIHHFEQLQSEIEPKEATLRQLERAVTEREVLLGHVHRERNEIKEQLGVTNAKLEAANTQYKARMIEKQTKSYGVSAVVSELAKALEEHGGNHHKALSVYKDIFQRNKKRLAASSDLLRSSSPPSPGSGTIDTSQRKGVGTIAPTTPASGREQSETISKKTVQQTDEELARQTFFLECRYQSQVRSISEKTSIAGINRNKFREENDQYLKDIRALHAERKAQAELLKSLESQLRDTRMELHAVVDAFEAQRKEREKESHQLFDKSHAQAKLSRDLLPPTEADFARGANVSVSAPSTPLRGRGEDVSSSILGAGASTVGRIPKASSASKALLPPLRSGVVVSVKGTVNAQQTATTKHNSNNNIALPSFSGALSKRKNLLGDANDNDSMAAPTAILGVRKGGKKSPPLLPPVRGGGLASLSSSQVGGYGSLDERDREGSDPNKNTAITTKAKSKEGEVGDDDDDDDDVLDMIKPSRIASKAKRAARERMAQRSQLEGLIDQLDTNTDVLRAQQEEIYSLRGFVKELLSKEETSVSRQVGTRIVTEIGGAGGSSSSSGALPLMLTAASTTIAARSNTPNGGGSGTSSSRTAGVPLLLRLVADGRHRGALAHNEAPEVRKGMSNRKGLSNAQQLSSSVGAVPNSSARASVPPTTWSTASASSKLRNEEYDDASLGIANDDDVNNDEGYTSSPPPASGGATREDVDWVGQQQARPMTPVLGPQ